MPKKCLDVISTRPQRGAVLLILHDERGPADRTLCFDVLTGTVCRVGQRGDHDIHITHPEDSQAHIRKTSFQSGSVW